MYSLCNFLNQRFHRHISWRRRSLVTADQAGQSAVGLDTEPVLGLLIRCLLP
jgi:hypothetical protein